MARRSIPLEEFAVRPYHLWDRQWLLLTAGDFASRRFNAMTVGWGSVGVMWNLPFVQVVVRPTRYTHGFMEEHATFTLCAFPEACRPALELLGTRSGRQGDKITASGLTPVPSTLVAAPSYAEAELVLECRKIYWADLEPAHFLDPRIEPLYPAKDYHRSYFGEILAALGEEGAAHHRGA